MFIVISIMFAGVAIGFALRRHEAVSRISSKMLMPVIYLLLLAMGVIVGSNPQLMSNIPTLGLRALVITIGAVLGSVVAAWAVWHKFLREDEK